MSSSVRASKNKVRFVVYGHNTDTPSSVTYSTVVSWYLVIIRLISTALKDMDLLSAYIESTYFTATCR